MTRTPLFMNRAESRDGAALVITFAVLSLLLVLGLSFVSMMRTERLTARAGMDSVKTRQLMHAALARSIQEIDSALREQKLYCPATNLYLSEGGEAAFSADVFRTGETAAVLPPARMPSGEWPAAGWQEIVGAEGVAGRYAFMAVDCSGLPDLNEYAGQFGDAADTAGFTAAALPGIDDPEQFEQARTEERGRFVSVRELMQTAGVEASTLNATVFSRYPQGRFADSEGAGRSQFLFDPTLGGAEWQEKFRGQWSAMLADIGYAAPENVSLEELAEMQNEALLAFFEPFPPAGDGKTFAAWRVPLINEIGFEFVLSRPDSKRPNLYAFQMDMLLELWCPFAGGFRHPVYPEKMVPSIDLVFEGLDVSGGEFGEYAAGEGSGSVSLPGDWAENEFRVERIPLIPRTEQDVNGFDPSRDLPSVRLPDIFLRLPQERDALADAVYAAKEITASELFAQLGTPAFGASNTVSVSWQTDDPRLNWDFSDTVHWRQGLTPTFGGMNAALNLKNGTPLIVVSDEPVFAGLNPVLRSLEAFGNLLYDPRKPWQTVPFTGAEALPLFDWFGIAAEAGAEKVFRGLVQLNAADLSALQAVLQETEVPDPVHGNVLKIDAPVAERVARILAAAQDPRKGSYRELLTADYSEWFSALGLESVNKPLVDALLARTMPLFGLRQNLFAAVVAVQSLDRAGNVAGEARAQAVIWRDAFPDEQGVHPCRILFFKWLNE